MLAPRIFTQWKIFHLFSLNCSLDNLMERGFYSLIVSAFRIISNDNTNPNSKTKWNSTKS